MLKNTFPILLIWFVSFLSFIQQIIDFFRQTNLQLLFCFFFFYTREGKEITPSSWEVTARLSSILISLSIRISKVAKWEREIMIFNLLFPHIVGSVRKIYSEETSELGISYSKLMSRRKLNIRYIFSVPQSVFLVSTTKEQSDLCKESPVTMNASRYSFASTLM